MGTGSSRCDILILYLLYSTKIITVNSSYRWSVFNDISFLAKQMKKIKNSPFFRNYEFTMKMLLLRLHTKTYFQQTYYYLSEWNRQICFCSKNKNKNWTFEIIPLRLQRAHKSLKMVRQRIFFAFSASA